MARDTRRATAGDPDSENGKPVRVRNIFKKVENKLNFSEKKQSN